MCIPQVTIADTNKQVSFLGILNLHHGGVQGQHLSEDKAKRVTGWGQGWGQWSSRPRQMFVIYHDSTREYFYVLVYNIWVSTVLSTGDVLTWLKLGMNRALWNNIFVIHVSSRTHLWPQILHLQLLQRHKTISYHLQILEYITLCFH